MLSAHGQSANTTDGTKLDVAASGFWGGSLKRERTLVDVRIFNPLAPSNSNSSFGKFFVKHEHEKMLAHERVREVVYASFDSFVL